jgi:hypothetical protein
VEHPQESTVSLTPDELRSHPLVYAALRLREENKVIHRAQRLSPILRTPPQPRRRTAHHTTHPRRTRSRIPSTSESVSRVAATYHGPNRPHIDASPPTPLSGTTTPSSDDDNFDLREFTRIRQERRLQQEPLSEDLEYNHPQVIRNTRSVISTHFYVMCYFISFLYKDSFLVQLPGFADSAIEVEIPLTRKGTLVLRSHADMLENEGVIKPKYRSLLMLDTPANSDRIWVEVKWGRSIHVGDRESLVFKLSGISTPYDEA